MAEKTKQIKTKGYIKDKKLIWKCRTKGCKGLASEMDGLCEECQKKFIKPQQKLKV
jgi:hypothetical protein